jgi:hypothetical protein
MAPETFVLQSSMTRYRRRATRAHSSEEGYLRPRVDVTLDNSRSGVRRASCTESPIRGEPRYGMAKPSSDENTRRPFQSAGAVALTREHARDLRTTLQLIHIVAPKRFRSYLACLCPEQTLGTCTS